LVDDGLITFVEYVMTNKLVFCVRERQKVFAFKSREYGATGQGLGLP